MFCVYDLMPWQEMHALHLRKISVQNGSTDKDWQSKKKVPDIMTMDACGCHMDPNVTEHAVARVPPCLRDSWPFRGAARVLGKVPVISYFSLCYWFPESLLICPYLLHLLLGLRIEVSHFPACLKPILSCQALISDHKCTSPFQVQTS